MTLRRTPERARAWQQRSAKPLKRGQELKRTGQNLAGATRGLARRSPEKEAFERELDAITPALIVRAGERCELRIPGVCQVPTRRPGGWTLGLFNRHHRKRRTQGAGNRLATLILCCGSGTEGCHGWVHAHPTASYARGWLVRGDQDPARVPWKAAS